MNWGTLKNSVPNMLSYGRLLATPFIVWMIAEHNMVAAFFIFVAAGISDALDGFFARRFNLVSDFGKMIDPVADKILLVSSYLGLCLTGYLPLWIGLVVLGRDILIVVAYLASSQKEDWLFPDPLRISKLNTAVQITLAAFVMLHEAFAFPLPGPLEFLPAVLLYGAGATTILSGASYLVRWVTTKGTMDKST